MPLIDKDKTVEAVATYLFVNDAIRGPEPKKVRDYLVFAGTWSDVVTAGKDSAASRLRDLEILMGTVREVRDE